MELFFVIQGTQKGMAAACKSSRTSRHNNFSAADRDAGVEYSLTHFSWRRERRSCCFWCLRRLPWGIQGLFFSLALFLSITCWQQPLRCTRSVTRLCSSAAPSASPRGLRLEGSLDFPPLNVGFPFALNPGRVVQSVASKRRQIYGRVPADAHVHISRRVEQRITARARRRSLRDYRRYHSEELTTTSQRKPLEECEVIRLIKQGWRCY